jgi:hypothetical protein
MKLIGMITVTVGAVAVGFAALLAVRSLPDIQRYLRIRSM